MILYGLVYLQSHVLRHTTRFVKDPAYRFFFLYNPFDTNQTRCLLLELTFLIYLQMCIFACEIGAYIFTYTHFSTYAKLRRYETYLKEFLRGLLFLVLSLLNK